MTDAETLTLKHMPTVQKVVTGKLRAMGQLRLLDDVLQCVLLRVWRSALRYENRGADFMAYLRRVLDGAVIDGLRETSPLEPTVQLTPEIVRSVRAETNTESSPSACLSHMSERQKDLIKRIYWHGCSQKRVAEYYGVTQGAISSAHARALRRVRFSWN